MEASKVRPFRVVAALGPSDRTEAVLEYALDQASRYERAELHLVTVLARGADEKAQAAAHEQLAVLAAAKLESFIDVRPQRRRVHLHVRMGDAGGEIVELVHDVEADLVLVGGTTSGGHRPRLGSVAAHVAQHVPCLVMLVRVADYVSHPLRDKQCPACVVTREETSGEHWFCHEHADRRSLSRALRSKKAEGAPGDDRTA